MDTNKTAHKLVGCWALGASVACFVCLLGEVAAFCAVRVGVKRTPTLWRRWPVLLAPVIGRTRSPRRGSLHTWRRVDRTTWKISLAVAAWMPVATKILV